MADLPTNFKDDILDTSVNTRRRYRVYENTDGTIELEDVTEYSQVGDVFGSGQINATNTEVNKKFDKNMLVRDLDTINAITKEGYVPDALALKEVNQSLRSLKIKEIQAVLVLLSTDLTGWSSCGTLPEGFDHTNTFILSTNVDFNEGGYYNYQSSSISSVITNDGKVYLKNTEPFFIGKYVTVILCRFE